MAETALVAVQRAYVEPVGVRFEPVKGPNDKILDWEAFVSIQNAGVTPTRLLRAHVQAQDFRIPAVAAAYPW